MLKIASYYKVKSDWVGCGCSDYWSDLIGQQLPAMLGDVKCFPRPYAVDSHHTKDYEISDEDFDINYLQLFDLPNRRPTGFVYSIISDVIGLEYEFILWLDRVRPDVIFTVQDYRDILIDLCKSFNCRCIYSPWCVGDYPAEYNPNRDIKALMTGAIGMCYPRRTDIHKCLSQWKLPDMIIKGMPDRNNPPMTLEQYRERLNRSRYYISGGVWDFEIPPKYYEVAAFGACLISHDMPMMEQSGFIDGYTYRKIEKVEDIPAILESDDWINMGQNARQMVLNNHLVSNRAQAVLEAYYFNG